MKTPNKFIPDQNQLLGTRLWLAGMDFVVLDDFELPNGTRVDIIGLGPKGEYWIIESLDQIWDHNVEKKWQDRIEWCDQFFFVVEIDYPIGTLPDETGIVVADSYGAEVARNSVEQPLIPSRRKNLTFHFARAAAGRLESYPSDGA